MGSTPSRLRPCFRVVPFHISCAMRIQAQTQVQAPTAKNIKFSFFCVVACPSVCVDVAQDTWDGFCVCFSYDCICAVHMIEQVLSFEFFQ